MRRKIIEWQGESLTVSHHRYMSNDTPVVRLHDEDLHPYATMTVNLWGDEPCYPGELGRWATAYNWNWLGDEIKTLDMLHVLRDAGEMVPTGDWVKSGFVFYPVVWATGHFRREVTDPLFHNLAGVPMPQGMRDRVEVLGIQIEHALEDGDLELALRLVEIGQTMLSQIETATYRVWMYGKRGWCKVSVSMKRTLDWGTYWRHDEGWSSEGWSLSVDPGGVVIRDAWSDGTDCDGRLSTHSTSSCRPEDLDAWVVDEAPGNVPRWQLVSRGQRDYAAERMGY